MLYSELSLCHFNNNSDSRHLPSAFKVPSTALSTTYALLNFTDMQVHEVRTAALPILPVRLQQVKFPGVT